MGSRCAGEDLRLRLLCNQKRPELFSAQRLALDNAGRVEPGQL